MVQSTRALLAAVLLTVPAMAVPIFAVPDLAGPNLARADEPRVDFNRDIRPILSNKCFTCHGPDTAERQAGLRLDRREGALSELESGVRAIVPGQLEQSELVARVISDDDDLRMPPAETGKRLSENEVALLSRWVREGAEYARHWSYSKPRRPELPTIGDKTWPRNEVDYFILARLEREGLRPSPTADRASLARRVALDLTGLPLSLEEVDEFLADQDPKAYERLVDRLLEKASYGEHWARKWLDLARYADSAGYADDPPRTIWAYRDYVIRSLNANKPFDQFTIEQIAGDLLPDPTQDQLMATAFHRNTLTNNEGGTSDEEFRNVAVVDRVNTTMATWMGTTVNCAQCHNHKYDPISQEEFFQLFAIFNNSADADRRDESPLLEIWTEQQEQQMSEWRAEIARLEQLTAAATPELLADQQDWERRLGMEPRWTVPRPAAVRMETEDTVTIDDQGQVLVAQPRTTNRYQVEVPLNDGLPTGGEQTSAAAGEQKPGDPKLGQPASGRLTGLRLEVLPHDALPGKGPGHAGGNFVITRVLASLAPPEGARPTGRYLRVENTGAKKILSLAEVQVYSGAENVAPSGEATQSSTAFNGPAKLAVDGNTDGKFDSQSTTHTDTEDNPWWELDLKSAQPIDRVVVWNRVDNNLHTRLKDFRVQLLDEQRKTVWEQTIAESPNPSGEYALSGVRPIKFVAAHADHAQSGFPASAVLDSKDADASGWAIAPLFGQPHQLTLLTDGAVEVPAGSKLTITIEQLSQHANHTLGCFRLALTDSADVSEFAAMPAAIREILKTTADQRTTAQQTQLTTHYLSIAPALQASRDRLAALRKQLADAKPEVTVPIMRELPEAQHRVTHIQRRGNFLDLELDHEVTAGVPEAIHPVPEDIALDRLALARWLIDADNPLTPRVLVNRYWEAIFGIGLVATSEEFGSQGELPSHPELLDWLATELVARDWDMKQLLRTLVTSATYRQSSRVTPELLERDPENRLLARGPRFRLSAEMVRDQALFVSGLLSDKMYGPPVKPPQPSSGLNAAFGGGIDWQTSAGEDKYRRGLYTTWRRSNPYPSMVAFDAPNREVCTVRRSRTNTPLQALVTLNDPVYIEAAQALARRVERADGEVADKARLGVRLCLARQPSDAELSSIVSLYERARQQFAAQTDQAAKLATEPLGPPPADTDVVSLAAWTVVANVLLNLDEMLMKR